MAIFVSKATPDLIPYVLTCASLVMSAMELALALEKLVNEKLHNLHSVATRCNDPQLTDFVESEFLQEQVNLLPYSRVKYRTRHVAYDICYSDMFIVYFTK